MIFFKCYDLMRNTCSGACQGCSDCLMVAESPTRYRMVSYVIKELLWRWKWKRIIKKVMKEKIK